MGTQLDTIEILRNLVEGLTETHWSSWQSTWKFEAALYDAQDYLKSIDESDIKS